jgi:hypothetical protein
VDVSEAREHEGLEQLAADAARADGEDLGARDLFGVVGGRAYERKGVVS